MDSNVSMTAKSEAGLPSTGARAAAGGVSTQRQTMGLDLGELKRTVRQRAQEAVDALAWRLEDGIPGGTAAAVAVDCVQHQEGDLTTLGRNGSEAEAAAAAAAAHPLRKVKKRKVAERSETAAGQMAAGATETHVRGVAARGRSPLLDAGAAEGFTRGAAAAGASSVVDPAAGAGAAGASSRVDPAAGAATAASSLADPSAGAVAAAIASRRADPAAAARASASSKADPTAAGAAAAAEKVEAYIEEAMMRIEEEELMKGGQVAAWEDEPAEPVYYQGGHELTRKMLTKVSRVQLLGMV